MRRIIIAAILIPVALLAIAGGIFYWIWDNHTYYRTDDAQVTGQIINISSPANGKLVNLAVKQGDTVTAGQTIGTVTVSPTTTTSTGLTAGAGASAKNQSANVAQPTSIPLTSPIDGTILMMPAVSGQLVSAGLTVAQVTNLNALDITAYVDENSIDNVKVGQAVDISVDAYKGTAFTGHVERIIQAAAGQFSLIPNQDNTSSNFTKVGQRIPVIITLDGKSGKDLLPGMSASITVHIS